MAITKFAFNPATGLRDTKKYTEPESGVELRAQLQDPHDQTLNFINGLIDILEKTGEEDGGASKIGIKTIPGMTDVANVQAALKWLKTAIEDGVTLSGALGDGDIVNSMLADLAVTAVKLAADAVETVKIKDLNVTEGKLAAASVTEEKIGTGAVTANKIGSGAITETKIGIGAVTEEKLADEAVTKAKTHNLFTWTKLYDETLTTDTVPMSVSWITNYNELYFEFRSTSGLASGVTFGTIIMPVWTLMHSTGFYMPCADRTPFEIHVGTHFGYIRCDPPQLLGHLLIFGR